jgi:hypothetical protein
MTFWAVSAKDRAVPGFAEAVAACNEVLGWEKSGAREREPRAAGHLRPL